jgi:hypothetical protein
MTGNDYRAANAARALLRGHAMIDDLMTFARDAPVLDQCSSQPPCSNEQMFGPKEQVPHAGGNDKEA